MARRKPADLAALLALPHVHARGGRAFVRVNYRDSANQWRSRERRVETIDDAVRALAELRAAIDGQDAPEPDRSRMTFADLLAEYAVAHPRKPRWYLEPMGGHFGMIPIRTLTYADCDRFRQARLAVPSTRDGGPRSVATINRELEVLRAVLLYAERHGWISRSPFGAGPPLIRKSAEPSRARVPTADEEARLLAACGPPREHLRALILAARDTGLRRSALLDLTWGAIDWDLRMLRVPPARSRQKARPGVIGLTARLAAELRARWEAADRPGPAVKIFGGIAAFKRSWRTACRLAGVTGLRFHDLRHGFATDLLEAGVNERLAMKLTGHSSEDIHAIYTNLDARLAATVAAALDGLHVARTRQTAASHEDENADSENVP